MRRMIVVFGLCASLSPAWAQEAPAKPQELQPLPELPAPPGGAAEQPLEPQVTILKRGQDLVEEYRINGRLYMLKITPPHGVPYYLVDQKGDGQYSRLDNLDSGVRVPQWVIHKF